MVAWWGRNVKSSLALKVSCCPESSAFDNHRRCFSQPKEHRRGVVRELPPSFDALDDNRRNSQRFLEKPRGRPSSRSNARNCRRVYAHTFQCPCGGSEEITQTSASKALEIDSASGRLRKVLARQAFPSRAVEEASTRMGAQKVANCVGMHKNVDGNPKSHITSEKSNLNKETLCRSPNSSRTCQDWLSLSSSSRDRTETVEDDRARSQIEPESSSASDWKDASLQSTNPFEGSTSIGDDGVSSRNLAHVSDFSRSDAQFEKDTWVVCKMPQGKAKDAAQMCVSEDLCIEQASFSHSLSQCSTCEEWEPLQSARLSVELSSCSAPPISDDVSSTRYAHDTQARVDLNEKLVEATRVLEALRCRIKSVQLAAEAEAAELCSRRQVASNALKELVGPPLAEIKRMANAPPESIRRTLAATWVLLHCDRFTCRSIVNFDDVREWPKVQRMLTKDSFVSQITNFSPDKLEKHPVVRNYLWNIFLGDQDKNRHVDKHSLKLSSKRTRSSSRQESKTRDSNVTSLEVVERASRPCGALARWMIALLIERQALKKLNDDDDLVRMMSELGAAEHHCAELTRAVNLVHAAKFAECAKQRAASALSHVTTFQQGEAPKEEEFIPAQLPARPKTAPPPEVSRIVGRELPIRELIRRRVHGNI